jgi:hypothetical protein
MKKGLFLLLAFASTFLAQAQVTESFTEDFEAYKKDDYLGVVNGKRWKVLFNDPASVADVKVSTAKAKSGKNSAFFFSNLQGGGPQNVYLPLFTDEKVQNSGNFELSMWLYIAAEQGAYFDLQALSPIPEATAVGIYFDNTKYVRLADEDYNTLGVTEYKQSEWLKFSIKGDLTNDEWIFSINDTPFSTLALKNNSLYALNIYPQSSVNQSLFYLDDIAFSFNQSPLKNLDAAITPIEIKRSDVDGKARFLVGKTAPIKTQIRNVGTQEITNMELEWSDGLSTNTQKINNLKLKSLTNQVVTLDLPYTAKVGANKISIKVKSVNGAADENATNDLREAAVEVIVPAADKKVLAEQATGTWCQWCPRGHVLMERMAVEYPNYFVGLALHASGNDPMKMNAYAESLKIQGYPTVVVDRGAIVDPGIVEDAFFKSVTKPSSAKIQTEVKWADLAARKLSVTPKAVFKDGAKNGTYRLVAILLEDSIRGTTGAYSQVNAYAGGQAGPMGGYEKLPSLVPYTKMVYKHVARALLNGVTGQPKTFSSIKADDVFELTPIIYDVPKAFDINRLEVITAMIAPDGSVDNADVTTAARFLVGAEEVASHPFFVKLAPNPASDISTISLNINTLSEIGVRVLDLNGKVVAMQSYGKLSGEQQINIETADLSNGLYLVQIAIDNQLLTQKMMVNH